MGKLNWTAHITGLGKLTRWPKIRFCYPSTLHVLLLAVSLWQKDVGDFESLELCPGPAIREVKYRKRGERVFFRLSSLSQHSLIWFIYKSCIGKQLQQIWTFRRKLDVTWIFYKQTGSFSLRFRCIYCHFILIDLFQISTSYLKSIFSLKI